MEAVKLARCEWTLGVIIFVGLSSMSRETEKGRTVR